MNLDMDEIAVLFRAHTDGQERFSRRMAIAMSDMDGTSPKSLVLRLERLKLLRPGSWEWFRANGGISNDQIAEVRAIRSAAEMEASR